MNYLYQIRTDLAVFLLKKKTCFSVKNVDSIWMKYRLSFATITAFSLMLLLACNKNETFQDPYGGGQSLLTISFLNKTPTPSRGVAGQDMTFYVIGLKSSNAKDIKFLANDIEATIKNITDSTITVTLPQNVSSGAASLRVDGQVFQGPNILVEGKLYRDATFKSGIGTNYLIYDILPDNNQYILAGSFSSYNASPGLGGIVKINASGEKVDALTAGYGVTSGLIKSIIRLPNNDLMIGGYFAMYDSVRDMSSITLLNSSAAIRTRVVDLYVAPDVSDPSYAKDTVPQFIGNITGFLDKVYYYNNQVTVVGQIYNYAQYFYERSSKDNKLIAYASILPICRMDLTGQLDSNYLFNKTNPNQMPQGFNGSIYDSYMQSDGKLIVAGSFTTFGGTTCNHILRLNTDGTIDNTFNSGSGANGYITKITYNAVTKKYIILGNFTTYNGASVNSMALLNEDGSLYNTFHTAGIFEGGVPTFAAQLNNGLILVTGSFEKYNSITRKGMMVLNTDGSMAADYNSTGAFNGIVYKMVETKSGIGGLPAVILVGYIDTFEGERCGGILKLVFGN